MRSVPVQDDLAEHFEPGPLPPVGPDGAPKLESVRELPPDPPRLCNQGPCRRYHQFQIQLDAQNPMDERKPDGTVVRHGRVFHIQTHHYCYPDVGIELELGALPVLTCNHWVPVTGLFRTKRGIRKRFERDVAAWQAEQQGAVDSVDVVAIGDADVEPEDYELRVTVGPTPAVALATDTEPRPPTHYTVVVKASATWPIRVVAENAFTQLELNPSEFTMAIIASSAPEDWDPPGYVEPIDNLEATIEQLELIKRERLLVTITTTNQEIPQ